MLKAKSKLFNLILLDIMIPDMGGLKVLDSLRKHHKATHLPVIMNSALDDSKEIVKALKLGVNDYINKPFDKKLCYHVSAYSLKLATSINGFT